MAIKLMYPVNGPITQYFGENPQIYQRWGYAGHNGIDFGIPNGTPIVAAADGNVEKTGFDPSGYGNFVKLSHLDGATKYATYYAHLQSIAVSNGQQVKAGVVVGLSNNTGASTGPHLHFGIKIEGQNPAFLGYLDPMPFLSAAGAMAPSSQASAAPGAIAGAVDLPGLDLEVIFDGVNVRSGPGVEYAILEQLKVGAKVKGARLYSTSAWVEFQPGKWCALTFNSSAFVKVTGRGSLSSLPAGNAAGAVRLPSLNLEVTDILKVRTGPGPENPDTALLNPGDKIVGRQVYAARAWIEIGKERWVALTFDGTQFLKFI